MKTYPELIAEGMKRTLFSEGLASGLKRDLEKGCKEAERRGGDLDLDWVVSTVKKHRKPVDLDDLMSVIQNFDIPNGYELEGELESELDEEDLLK